jgi:hypothetical protein
MSTKDSASKKNIYINDIVTSEEDKLVSLQWEGAAAVNYFSILRARSAGLPTDATTGGWRMLIVSKDFVLRFAQIRFPRCKKIG